MSKKRQVGGDAQPGQTAPGPSDPAGAMLEEQFLATQHRPPPSSLARTAFHLIWVAAIPLTLGILTVWWIVPPRGQVEVSVLRELVGEQRIPAGILFATLFGFLIWRYRHSLPLAGAAGMTGYRKDVSAPIRDRLDDASGLLEETRRIVRSKRRELGKELTDSERRDLFGGLIHLEKSMNAAPFSEPEFEKSFARADKLVGEHLSRWRKGELREIAEAIGLAFLGAVLLKELGVEAFKIPSGSMIPTLLVGDHIFVNKAVYGPKIPFTERRIFTNLPPVRSDVMVFKFPEKPEQDFIKRVIAQPGDTLAVVDGRPILNGWIVPHCHVGTFRDEGQDNELYVEFLEDRSYFTLMRNPTTDQACQASSDCPLETSCYFGQCGHEGREYRVREGEVWVLGDNRDNSLDSRAWNFGNGAGVPFDHIKGRAMIVFATFGGSEGVSDRFLVNVMGTPKLPESNSRLQPALDKCLRERPKNTSPPRPSR